MSGHLILLSIGLSIGLHVIGLSGASSLLPNSDSNLHAPVEVVLVEFSEPAHNSGDPIASVAAVKSSPSEMSTRELEIANDMVSYQERRYDAVDVSVAIKEPTTKPAQILSDSHAPENSVVQGDQVVALPADVSVAVKEPTAKPAQILSDSHASESSVVQGDQVVALPADVELLHYGEMSGVMRQDVQYLSRANPRYPRLARKRGWEGTVLLAVEVLSTGNVGTIRVTHSSGHKVLDRAAQKAAETWRFSVSGADGLGVTATVEIPVTFKLDSPGARNRG